MSSTNTSPLANPFAAEVAQTKVLIHAGETDVHDVIHGHLITLPPLEPVELPAFIADAVMQHIGKAYGVVAVPVLKTKTGTQFDLDAAIDKAKKELAAGEKAFVDEYVKSQMEGRIAAGKPALPPNDRVASILKSRGISLAKDYGLRPIGWADDGDEINTEVVMSSKRESELLAQIAELKAENEALAQTHSEQLDAHAEKQNTLEQRLAKLEAILNGEPATTGEGAGSDAA